MSNLPRCLVRGKSAEILVSFAPIWQGVAVKRQHTYLPLLSHNHLAASDQNCPPIISTGTGRRDFLFSQVCCCALLLSSTGRWLSRRCLPPCCLLALPPPQQQCHAHPRASIQTQRHAPRFYGAQVLERATDTSVLQAPGANCSLI